ncbi:MAG TPA: pilus assembly protein TadG-related protein, partial [Methylomirabilota bacterium]|nr:pilus assembly protein TadG-related protein [Methylomirabilota bacterium]
MGRAASSRTRCLSSGRCRLSRSIGDLRPSRRRQGSPVELRRSTQRGQAIVLIGIMVAVVVGMAALAVDGARAYALRRDLQAATDAAALAAADSYQQYRNYTSAESAATTSFGQNIRLYVSPSCSPAYGAPPRTITCNYSDHTVLTEAVTALGAAGVQFTIGATRSLVLQFARILTSGSSPQLTAIASAGVNNLLYTPTVAALSQAGCGGMPGNAITTTSAGILNIVGDMVSSGAISIAGTASITGDVYARCQSSVTGVTTTCYPSGNSPPCTYPDVVGVTRSGYNFADPRYPAPPLVGSAQPRPPTGGGPVVLAPGSYAMDPALGPGFCYFLAGGVYKWQGGYTNNGSFVSNELRPPDEPMYNNNTVIAGHQLWDTDSVGCSGSFQVSSLTGSPVVTREGTWAFVLTSVRSAIYNGVSYIRESAPSMCRTVFVGDNQVVQIQVSNVPGAVSYNVYAAVPNNGCSGPFGLAGSIAVAGSVQNTATGACPAFSGTGCSLGHESAIFDAGLLGV